MKRLLALASLLILGKFSAQTWNTEEQYIQRFAKYAVEEMEKYKIPASITLAQGILETGGGQSRLAKEGNNHFGIKCKDEWTGKSMKHTDDAPNECFRVYDNPRDSYEDHSKFLAFRQYYVNLFKLDMKDYKAWAHGLKKAGYATNPKYAYILISKIEKHRLYEFDNSSTDQLLATMMKLYPDLQNDKAYLASLGADYKPTKSNVEPAREVKPTVVLAAKTSSNSSSKSPKELLETMLVKNHPNGGRKYVVIPSNTSMDYISKKFGINEKRLMKYNESSTDLLQTNDIVFLEAKGGEGNVATYKSRAGESMYDISQKFGIKLSKLLSKNRMDARDQLKAGQLVYLQQKRPRS